MGSNNILEKIISLQLTRRLPTTSYLHKNTETIKYRIYNRARSLFPTPTDDFAGILRILLAIVDMLLSPRAVQ